MRYSYTQVALFALTASALPTNIARDPQLLGGLVDAGKDIFHATGSIISPFAEAGKDILGGTLNGAKDVAGGIASGIFGYKEKREPQLLGGLVDAGYDLADAAGSIASPFVEAGSSIVGGLASGVGDVAGGVASGIFGYKEKREPQLLGGLVDAGYDLADAAGSVASPFIDAGSSIVGGLASGTADVIGGVASGVFGYKEKREPQIIGSLIGHGIEAGADIIGNVASIPGDVLSSLSGYGSDYDEEYKKSKRSPQILGSLIGHGIQTGADIIGNVASIPGDVLSSLSGYGSDYDDEYKKNKRQLLGDLLEDGEDIVEEVLDKREPQGLVGSLVGGLTGTLETAVDGLLGGYSYDDEDRVPEVIVVAPEAPAAPYKRSAQPQGLVGGLVDGLLGDRYGYEYEGRRHRGDRHGEDLPEVVVVPVGYEGGNHWKA